MRGSRTVVRALALTAALFLLSISSSIPAVATVVDDFQTAQSQVSAPEPGPSASSVNGAGILGGDRDLSIERLSGISPVFAEVTGGVLEMADGSGRGAMTVTYDADSNPDVLDPDGLGGVDLTDGDSATGLRVVTTTVLNPIEMTVTVHTDATLVSRSVRRLTAAGTTVIDFAGFRAVGSAGGADFTNVGAVEVTFATASPPPPPPPPPTTPPVDPAPTVLPVPVIEVDLIDTVGPSLDTATKDAPASLLPGQTLTYQIEVPNTGGAARDVMVADVIDPNLTVVADSLTTRPFAVDDEYEAVGNVQLAVDAASGLLSNDRDVDDGAGPSSVMVSAFDATSVGGGTVAVMPDGSFTYTSPAGFSGVDTFGYTVTDDETQTDTGTVNVEVSGTVWFVENTVAPGGTGTFEDPFHALASAEAASSPGDTIRVRRGDGTDTNHDVGIDLKANQKLIGAGVPLVIAGVQVEPADPMGAPVISHTDHVVDLHDDVEVRGVGITANALVDQHGIRGSAISGQIAISDAVIGGNGSHGGVLLTLSPAADLSLTDVDVTAGAEPALAANGVQSVTIAGSCDFVSAGTVMDIASTTLTGTVQSLAGAQARYSTLAAASNFAVQTTTTLTNPTTDGLRVDNSPNTQFAFGTTSVTDDSIGSGASGNGVNLATGNAGSTIGFASLTVVADGGTGLLTGAGTVDIASATSTVAATGGPAIDALSTAFTTGGAGGATFASLTSTNSANRGIRLQSTTGAVSVTGTTMISGAATVGLEADSAGAFSTDVLSVGGASGIDVVSSGAISVANATGSQVVSTAGPAIDISDTDIGAAGMHFTSVMASNTGANPGIVFNNVDAGAFTAAGTTIAGTGPGQHGIHLTGSAAAFTFNGTTAVDDTGGDGIRLVGANGAVAFNSVAIDDTGGNGVTVSGNVATVDINGGTIGETAGSGTTTTENAVDVDGGSANVTIAAAIRNTAARSAEITARSGGTVEISGAINDTGTGIRVASNTSGLSRFSNASKVVNTGANTAVTLAGNMGHPVEFTNGGLDLDTTTATAFDASGGGSVIVSRNAGTGNSVATTTGTAVRIDGVTIGASHVEWQRIDSTTASANTAIILATTGAGEFRVTGTGTTAGSGGTISDKTTDAVTMRATGGLVHLRNMVIEDIGAMGGAIDTVSGHDAIHGENVTGGLRLEGARISRTSDMAIHGATFASAGATTFTGLEILDSTIEDTNRYHVANIGDDNNEGMIRVRGLSGTVRVIDSILRRGAELLDLNSATTGTLTMTVQESTFEDSFKGIAALTQAAGLACINLKMEQSADAVIHIGDPLEANAALGNSFNDCATVAIGIKHLDENYAGDTDVIISRNTLVADLGFGGVGGNPFGFGNQPGTGILLRPQGTSAATLDAVVSQNSLTRSGLAEGQIGAITVQLDSAGGVTSGTSQVRVSDNTITTPVAAPIFVLAERNTAARVLLSDNTIVPGIVSLPDFGPSSLPGNSTQVRTREDGQLDVTVEEHFFPAQDTVFVETGESFKARTIGGASGIDRMCLSMRCPAFPGACGGALNNTSDLGYRLRNDAGTFLLHQGASASAVPQTILQGNNNRGGGGNPNADPPTVTVLGAVTSTAIACALPSGSITGGTF